MNSNSIIHENIFTIEKDYYRVKSNIKDRLNEWSDLYVFDDAHIQIRYKTEGPLIPEDNGKIPILILLSNPHPHSVKQGMFLSPNRSGRENPFWNTLRDSGYFQYSGKMEPDIMIKNGYQSPFRFFIAVLLPFPSEDPTHLEDILGTYEYGKMLIEGKKTIRNLISGNNIKGIICFGKLQYDSLSRKGCPNNYTAVLNEGGIIRDDVSPLQDAKIYLTYPTGWRFIKNHQIAKATSLKTILTDCQSR